VNKVDRELAKIEARRAELEREAPAAPKSTVRGRLKRWTRDAMVRRTSTKG
jgi:hypothetical protein